ncbi:selenide, water dikinase SelD [Azospirillum sp. TSO35-2]|uniref:selenide, water dikinase SelD n=1 Tax=Azospirillum sp. TSO35-2 TaxID=716796 RepID=UPI000D61F2BE|nr:selenide, water dikinase SelD [Azospirillum sp. TSO35-2]PWC35972.1 selenophosphate synthase [Azospirillum sp. TSO35-2]
MTASAPTDLVGTMPSDAPRLTSLAHGGGCGCKIAPGVLQGLLATLPGQILPPELIVDASTADDAAVYRLNDDQALVATTDFFMPIVDDPFDFGRIAATNALSDIYAMGGRPILALAIVGMPIDSLPPDAIRRVLEGGQSACAAAGIPVAGGHSIDSREPIYGLVALGLVHPDHVLRNSSARPGDLLVLGKPLGIGVYSAALKKGALGEEAYRRMIDSTTCLNTPGGDLAALDGVHAVTDVTGFGLLGHLLEICRGSRVSADIRFGDLPFFPDTHELAQAGHTTGASTRNWASYGAEVRLPAGWTDEQEAIRRKLMTDPQTSGGLLVACAAERVGAVLDIFRRHGHDSARVIGRLEGQPGDGPVEVRVT